MKNKLSDLPSMFGLHFSNPPWNVGQYVSSGSVQFKQE